MRRLRYQVACSLDGYIAGPGGEFDWIPMDPDIDFGELAAEYDTLVMGRRTFEIYQGMPGMKALVCSRTLRQEDHPDIEIVADDVAARIRALKEEPGRDIWLYGGGELFRALLAAGCVDTVEPAIIPILLGDGVPLVPGAALRQRLRYAGQRLYERTGTLLLRYDVVG